MSEKHQPTVYFSNSVEQLLVRLKENLQAGARANFDPFYSAEIVVSDIHVKTYLKLELAKSQGILFGVTFSSITELAESASMIRFLDIFIAANSIEANPELAISISNELALEAWYGCQKSLIPSKTASQFAQAQKILGKLKTTTVKPPNETHVFAVSALCSNINDLLFLRPNTTYYVLSPCMHFWSDICSDYEAKRLTRKLSYHGLGSKQVKALEGYLYDRSKLLANNGTRSREFIEYLEERLNDFHEEYVVKKWVMQDPAYGQYIRQEAVCTILADEPNLLDILKNDLLLMGPKSESMHDFSKSDRSIQIHKAPTIAREVEVLYQYIQQILPVISGQIVVYAPDIEVYKPYIKSLFTHSCEIISPKQQELLPLFLQILDMPHKRMSPKKTFDLFQVEAFRKKCGIEIEDLPLIATCLENFDVDQTAFKEQVILSWISRLADVEHVDSQASLQFLTIELGSSDAEVLGNCLEILESLYNDIKKLESQKIRLCIEWQRLFLDIFIKYFEPAEDEQNEFYAIKQALLSVCQNPLSIQLHPIEQEQALNIFKQAFSELEEKKQSPILAPIIFATLGVVRTLPKDAVCFIGMHEGAFPRTCGHLLRKYGFLHSTNAPYTINAIDRHLFIEGILTTSSMLYISYQSYGFKERSFLEPSAIVLEILETLDSACTVHNELPSKMLVNDHCLESCQESATANMHSSLQVGQKLNFQNIESQKENSQNTLGDVLYIHDLNQVAKYPLRSYMQHGLGLYLGEYKPKVRSSEFEVLDPRALGMAKKQVFVLPEEKALTRTNHEYRFLPPALRLAASSLLKEDIELLYKNAKIFGIMPSMPLNIELSLTSQVVEKLDSNSWKIPALSFDIGAKKVTLAGVLKHIYPQGIAVFEKKSNEALYKVWPEVLLLNYLAGLIPIEPNVLFLKDAKLQAIKLDNANQRLKEYIQYAISCQSRPSCVYPDWIDALQKTELPPALITESSSYNFRDPYLDLYLSRISHEEFEVQWKRSREEALKLFK